jgi:hypothetical protein
MGYIVVNENRIQIGEVLIELNEKTVIHKIQQFNDKVFFSTTPQESDLDWNDINTHKIWKDRCEENPPLLYAYYENGNFAWQFPFPNVTGFEIEIPEQKKPEEFVTLEYYKSYINKFGGTGLLIVYAGDFYYRVDANTGEIYGKSESR